MSHTQAIILPISLERWTRWPGATCKKTAVWEKWVGSKKAKAPSLMKAPPATQLDYARNVCRRLSFRASLDISATSPIDCCAGIAGSRAEPGAPHGAPRQLDGQQHRVFFAEIYTKGNCMSSCVHQAPGASFAAGKGPSERGSQSTSRRACGHMLFFSWKSRPCLS